MRADRSGRGETQHTKAQHSETQRSATQRGETRRQEARRNEAMRNETNNEANSTSLRPTDSGPAPELDDSCGGARSASSDSRRIIFDDRAEEADETLRHAARDGSAKAPGGSDGIIGTNTASGKSSLSAALAAFFASASVQVRMLRIETGERRREFPDVDLFIDVNRAGGRRI